ncbi:MAG: flagellar type III secretion system pore protein FliP [Candidatus Lindowbacteria bacterium]|nr:flagellar type III secretion system pore protein FliP [Candidatus Lindowbacteria bacterium]
MNRVTQILRYVPFGIVLVFILVSGVQAQIPNEPAPPYVSQLPKITFIEGSDNPEDVTMGIKFLFLLTFFAVAPTFILMTTCYARVVILLSFVKRAMGTQDLPPRPVTMSLALFLSFFIMAPTITEIKEAAWDPYQAKEITTIEAYDSAIVPVRNFMFRETREKDLGLFVKVSGKERPETRDDIPTYVLIPAFMISEMTTAFLMGIYIFLPFLVIDMVIASVLMSMGMIMLPPVMISLPFKIIIFVLVDGWHLIAYSVVQSFGGGV